MPREFMPALAITLSIGTERFLRRVETGDHRRFVFDIHRHGGRLAATRRDLVHERGEPVGTARGDGDCRTGSCRDGRRNAVPAPTRRR